MRRRLPNLGGSLPLALVACLALGACGSDGPDDLASYAPPDAPLFAQVAIDPDSEQTEALTDFAERVSGVDDPLAALRQELDQALAEGETGLDFEEDVEPWLGDHAAVFVRSFEPSAVADGVPDFAAIVEVDDADDARSFLDRAAANESPAPERRSYDGHDYLFDPEDGGVAVGLVDDGLVVGTESAFMVAVDASEGESLAESSEYADRTGALSDDRVATAFFEPGPALEAAIANGELKAAKRRLLQPLLSGPLAAPFASGLSADDGSLSLEVAATAAEDELGAAAPMIESLPSGSWLAVAAPDLGATLARILDQVEKGGLPGARAVRQRLRAQTGIDLHGDLLAWLGGASLFVEGTGVPGLTAGLIAETYDARGPRRLLARARELIVRRSGLRSSGPPGGAAYGFSVGIPSLGGGAEAGVVGGRLVAVFGGTVAEALEPERTLADDERFAAAAEALGDEFDPNLYLHLPSLLDVAERGGASDDPDYVAAAPYLSRLEALLSGTRLAEEQVVSRWTLTLARE